jgi:hypothetical protein
MKKILLLILPGLMTTAMFAQDNAVIYEPAKLTLKNGTTKDVILEVTTPLTMQAGVRCFDPKLLSSGNAIDDKQKEKFSPSDLKEIRTKKKIYEVKKYADMSGEASLSSFGKLYIMEVAKPGKLSLYNYYSEKPEPELLIGKKGEDKLKAVGSTALMKFIEDTAPIKDKFKAGAYGNNPKNDNAMFNDNLSFIGKLVDDYNEFAALGRFLTPEEKTNRKKLSQAIIFDLFMNYELTLKNGNLNVIIDYIPSLDKKEMKRVELTSNYGHEDEKTNFVYNDKFELQQIVYQHADKQYNYEFNYSNGLPVSVNIAGKKRIEFLYSYDTLKSIVREQNGTLFEHDLTYLPDQPKADIKFFVTNKGKRQASSSNYFVGWNNDYKLTDYSLDMYTAKGITYANGGVASFTTSNSDGKEIVANWEYSADEKSNWTERKLDKFAAKRAIEYVAR